uniref:Uncharacterized protein n=1 Tax=Skeletonema marinoi TaxID=267567 RepID=A0A7S2KVW0_9STRA
MTFHNINIMTTTTNNHLVADEAGVEIIPDTTVTATEESNVLVVDAAAPPKSWMTKELFIGIGALMCVTVGVVYFLAGSPTSSKMTNFSSSNQMQQTAKKGRYKFKQFGDNDLCLDSQIRVYSFIRYGSVSSAEDCGVMCSNCPGNDQDGLVLRGFIYYGPQFNLCDCLVDVGISFEKELCEGATGAIDTLLGSGEIVNTQPQLGVQCWKVSSPSSSKARKSSKAPKSSKRRVRKLGQKNDSLSNVKRKTNSQTISE